MSVSIAEWLELFSNLRRTHDHEYIVLRAAAAELRAACELAASYRETGDSERTQAALKKYQETCSPAPSGGEGE